MALATMRALNRAIITTRADVSTRLKKETGVRVKVIKTRLVVIPPKIDKLEAILRVGGTPVPAIEYRAKQTPTGVTFGTGSSRAFLKGSFIATMKSGHRGVYSRSRPSRSRRGKPRSSPALPIFERFGPPLSIVALRTEILKSSLTVGQEAFQKNLAHELRRRLGTLGQVAS
jgi:Prophage minor tail protein Z (GPZ)